MNSTTWLTNIRSASGASLAILSFVVVAAPVDVLVMRLFAGGLLVLILPGKAIARIVLQDRPSDWSATLLLTVALSIAITIVGGLVLFLFAIATTYALSGYLTAVSLGGEAFGRIKSIPGHRASGQINLVRLVSLGVPAAVALAAVSVAIVLAVQAQREDTGGDFTTFGVSSLSSTHTLYQIALTSHSGSQTRYVVDEVTTAGRSQVRAVTLAPHGSLTFVIHLVHTNRPVHLVLRRPGTMTAYRSLYLAPSATARSQARSIRSDVCTKRCRRQRSRR